MQLIYRSLLFSFGYALKVPVSTFIFKLLAPVFVPSRPYNILYCNIKKYWRRIEWTFMGCKMGSNFSNPEAFF